MKRILAFVGSICCMFQVFICPATSISNVRAIPRESSGIVDVYYDLYSEEGGSATVKIELIDDSDEVIFKTYSGDVGAGVRLGKNRKIIWDALTDNGTKAISNVRVCISATVMDQEAEPGLTWIPRKSCSKFVVKNINAGIYGGRESDSVTCTSGGGFYADRRPVSYALWYKVYEWGVKHGYKFSKTYSRSTSSSAISVISGDAWIWCNARSEMEGLPVCNMTDHHGSYSYLEFTQYSSDNGGYRIPDYYALGYLMHTGGAKGMGSASSGWITRGSGDFASGWCLGTVSSSDGIDTYKIHGAYAKETCPLWCIRDKKDRYPVVESVPANFSNSFDVDYASSTGNQGIVRDFRIERIASKYCSGEYGQGNKATFISGVNLNVEFEASVSGGVLGSVLVNDRKYDGAKFTIDVGSYGVGEQILVRAVSSDGRFSRPYRLNFDVARSPGIGYGIKKRTDDSVVYGSGSFESLPIFEGLNDRMEMGVFTDGEPFKLTAVPAFSFDSEVDSRDGKKLWSLQIGASSQDGLPVKRRGMIFDFAGLKVYGSISASPADIWNPKTLRWENISNAYGINYGGEASRTHYFFPCLFFRLTGRSNGTYFGEWKDGFHYSFDGDLLALNGTGGLGFSGLLSGELFLECALHHSFDSEKPGRTETYLYGSVGCYMTFLGKRLGEKVRKFGGADGALSLDEFTAEPDPKGLTESVPIPIDRTYLDGGVSGTATKPYLIGGGGEVVELISSSDTTTTLQNNGSPVQAPTWICGGAKDGENVLPREMVIHFDNPDRRDGNQHEIGTVASDGNGHYKIGGRVWDDGTSDYNPNGGVTKKGTGIISWMNVKKEEPVNATFGDEMSDMEIAVATKADNQDGWTAKNLTNDSAFDHSPVICTWGNDSATVVWIRNEYGNYHGSVSAPNKIMFADFEDGQWSAPGVVAENIGEVQGLSFAVCGRLAVISYSEKLGEKQCLKAILRVNGEWRTAIKIEEYNLTRSVVVRSYEKEDKGAIIVIWNGEESFHTAEINSDGQIERGSVELGEEIVPNDFTVASSPSGSVAIAWIVSSIKDPGIKVPMVMMRHSQSQVWSLPCRLLDTGTYAPTYSVQLPQVSFDENDDLRILYARCPKVEQDDMVEVDRRRADVATTCRHHAPDVGIDFDSISFEPRSYASGDVVRVYFEIKNYGDRAASNINVSAYLNGSRSARLVSETISELNVREIKVYSLDWTATMDSGAVRLSRISVSCTGDCNSYNNSYYEYSDENGEGEAVLTVSGASGIIDASGTCRLAATIRNEGELDAQSGTKAVFRKGGESGDILGVTEVGKILNGTGGQVDVGCEIDASVLESSEKDGQHNVLVTVETPTNMATFAQRSLKSVVFVEDNRGKGCALVLKNGGNGDMDKTLTSRYDVTETLPDNGNARPGFVFKGWAIREGGEVVYDNCAKIRNPPMYAQDVATLYAIWEEIVATSGTDIPVPFEWVLKYYPNAINGIEDVTKRIEIMESIAQQLTGKVDGQGKQLAVWHDFVLGTDPTDPSSKFIATIEVQGGKPVVKWTPALNGTDESGIPNKEGVRTYKVMGSRDLKTWSVCENGHEEEYNYFKIVVETP